MSGLGTPPDLVRPLPPDPEPPDPGAPSNDSGTDPGQKTLLTLPTDSRNIDHLVSIEHARFIEIKSDQKTRFVNTRFFLMSLFLLPVRPYLVKLVSLMPKLLLLL